MFDVLKSIKVYSWVQLFEYEREGVLLVFSITTLGSSPCTIFDSGKKVVLSGFMLLIFGLHGYFQLALGLLNEFVEIMLAGF